MVIITYSRCVVSTIFMLHILNPLLDLNNNIFVYHNFLVKTPRVNNSSAWFYAAAQINKNIFHPK